MMATIHKGATYLAALEPFEAGQVDIEGDAYRHLFRARRLAVGDSIRVVDGRGRARSGLVESVEKSRARVVLGSSLPSLESALRLHLLVGALRPERASWLVEKATELGVASLTFVATERTPRDYGKGKLERWRRVAAAALEQCGRATLPAVDGVVPLEQALARAPRPVVALMPKSEPLVEVIAEWIAAGTDRGTGSADMSLVVGPEGGFGPADERLIAEQGARSGRLGSTILRVETAALAAASLALCR